MRNRRGNNGESKFLNVIIVLFGIMTVVSMFWLYQKEQKQIMMSKEGQVTLSQPHVIVRIILTCILMAAGYIIYKKFIAVKALKEKEYDKKILTKVIAELVPGAVFDRDKCINPEKLFEKGIIPRFTIFKESGLLSYQKEGKKYSFSNIHLLRYKEDSEEHGYYETIYKGQVYAVNYAAKLQGEVRLFATRKIAVVKVKTDDGYAGRREGERKIETENVMFNDNFDIYATSEQSAFYVLSPYVMEQLLEMKKKYKQISVYISGNDVVISLETNSFLLSKKVYFDNRVTELSQEAKGEVKKVLKMAEVLENTINGSIKNNFTNM